MRKEASLNQWKELYDETLKLKALEPWKYLDSADLIAIKLQGMEEPVFMSVMGRLGTCYGVSMYEGMDGLADFDMVANAEEKNGPAIYDTMMDQSCICLLYTSSVNDAGWNAAAYNGMKAIESEMGAEINFSENVSLPDAEPALRDFSNKGYNLIFAHSMEYGESVTKIAGDYPDTKYAVYTGTVEADNVASISLNEHETGYLAGMLAASMSCLLYTSRCV